MRKIYPQRMLAFLEGTEVQAGNFYTDNPDEEPPLRFWMRFEGEIYNCSYNDPTRFRFQVLCHECGGFIERYDLLVFNRYNPLENQWHIECVKKITGIE